MTRYSGLLWFLTSGLLAQAMANTQQEKEHVRRKASPSQQNARNVKEDDIEGRIVGGTTAAQGRYPYMVSLWSDSTGNNRHECGGILVAPDVVLTAAHCITNGENNPNVKMKNAVLGRLDKTDATESTSHVIAVTQYVYHPSYDQSTDECDVGLLKLETTSVLAPATINGASSAYSDGDTLTTLGWGDLGNGTFPDKLQQVQVKYLLNSACKSFPDPQGTASYQDFIFDDMMCATLTGKDGCYGDSGGPLLIQGSSASSDIVVGVVSWGIGCARMPGVYARIDFAENYNWIVDTICDLSENPPFVYSCPETNLGVGDDFVAPTPAAFRDDGGGTPPPPLPNPPAPTPAPTPEATPSPTPLPTPAPTPSPTTAQTSPSPTTEPTDGYTVVFTLPPAFLPPPTPTVSPADTPTEDRGIEQDTHEDEREGMIWMEESSILPSTSFGRRACTSWTVAVLSMILAMAGVVLL